MVSEMILSSGSLSGYLDEHKKVALDGVCSDPVLVLSGVPQGSVLESILFLIFINDLPGNKKSTARLFANDCFFFFFFFFFFFRNIRRSEYQQILQR